MDMDHSQTADVGLRKPTAQCLRNLTESNRERARRGNAPTDSNGPPS